jgi:hypothetical protein
VSSGGEALASFSTQPPEWGLRCDAWAVRLFSGGV